MNSDDLEDWLLDAGDQIIGKKSELGYDALSKAEQAIYCLWVIDYAVRNSGTLEPMRELYPSALTELDTFATESRSPILSSWLASATNEPNFCQNYAHEFGAVCAELHRYSAST